MPSVRFVIPFSWPLRGSVLQSQSRAAIEEEGLLDAEMGLEERMSKEGIDNCIGQY